MVYVLIYSLCIITLENIIFNFFGSNLFFYPLIIALLLIIIGFIIKHSSNLRKGITIVILVSNLVTLIHIGISYLARYYHFLNKINLMNIDNSVPLIERYLSKLLIYFILLAIGFSINIIVNKINNFKKTSENHDTNQMK